MGIYRNFSAIFLRPIHNALESKTQISASNQYNLDLSVQTNFVVSTEDTNNKTLALINPPGAAGDMTAVSIVVNYQHAITITPPSGITWQGDPPTYEVGKRTLIFLMSYDGGVTWLGSWATGWPIGA